MPEHKEEHVRTIWTTRKLQIRRAVQQKGEEEIGMNMKLGSQARNEVSASGGLAGLDEMRSSQAFGLLGRLFTLTLYEAVSLASHRFGNLSVYIGTRDILSQRQDYWLPSFWIRGNSIAITAHSS